MKDLKTQKTLTHIRRLTNKSKIDGLLNRKSKPVFTKRESSSDLWIPRRKISKLNHKIAKCGSLKRALTFLLNNNRNRLTSFLEPSRKEKTSYQKGNLNLVRFSLRPDASDWAELRLLARYYGMSICNFFVILLDSDKTDNESLFAAFGAKIKNLRLEKSAISLIQHLLPKRKLIIFSIAFDSKTIHAIARKSSA
ncbi:DUF1564 family protein [Leptospira yasudae]|uniref:DUF1564 family protein n=1 Tax=Leptospira yasudae TaxID=2202201 RepID=A0A6N4QXB3_9LEPT|nr:DUF1564 family protein [Leptospira yasudae]TGL76091.1 DUF1564 family protein [Leptospira yasudae]TGL83557.1 DUF1564 family protein [Leptospira yasudae]TGL85461.1 DUF1564 family protein [Leptospira yasudae]